MTDPEIKSVSLEDDHYPLLLKETNNPPKTIFYRGVLPKSDEALVAMVGTRKATEEGKIVARTMARELAGSGIAVVSGLALGIDAASHAGALEASSGRTIAVLANGLDAVYPATNERLALEILKSGGCVMSEYQAGEPPLPYKFLERNRIVAGLGIATIVIEAPRRSGSLVTARLAAEEGRDVFVVPGEARNKNYEGSHLLIRNGARLAANAGQILDDLENTAENYGLRIGKSVRDKTDFDDEEKIIVSSLEEAGLPLDIDKLSEMTHLETHIINQKLTFLALRGIVVEIEGKFKIKHEISNS